jgi:hypothetical protein
VNDETRNKRRELLDAWIRELLMNPKLIFDFDTRSELYKFLDVPKNLRIADSLDEAGATCEFERSFPSPSMNFIHSGTAAATRRVSTSEISASMNNEVMT